eukprot:scaffold21431_cov101-Isochrysis_galbana.AAC.3
MSEVAPRPRRHHLLFPQLEPPPPASRPAQSPGGAHRLRTGPPRREFRHHAPIGRKRRSASRASRGFMPEAVGRRVACPGRRPHARPQETGRGRHALSPRVDQRHCCCVLLRRPNESRAGRTGGAAGADGCKGSPLVSARLAVPAQLRRRLSGGGRRGGCDVSTGGGHQRVRACYCARDRVARWLERCGERSSMWRCERWWPGERASTRKWCAARLGSGGKRGSHLRPAREELDVCWVQPKPLVTASQGRCGGAQPQMSGRGVGQQPHDHYGRSPGR